MKAVLISIHPRHCENIASGKKTVEVRKSKPKLEIPFRCYIYMTKKDDGTLFEFVHDGDELYGETYRGKAFPVKGAPFGWTEGMQGKVIGEFVCDRIDTIRHEGNGFVAGGVQQSEWRSAAQTLIQAACLTEKELKAYLGNDYGYGWHISNLKIYDKPKELSEFTTPFCPYEVAKCKVGARLCKHYTFEDALGGECDYAHRVTRPPQSWMYVEEVWK